MSDHWRWLGPCAMVAIVCVGAGRPSFATDFFWNQPDGGLFGDPANWNDGASGVPGAGDVAIFDLFAAFTVDLDESRTGARMIVRRSILALEMSEADVVYELVGGTVETPGLVIADDARNTSSLDVRRGILRAEHVTIGRAPTSAGRLTLGRPTEATDLETSVLRVGDAGTGFLDLDGGTINAGRAECGVSASGYGELAVDGPDASLNVENKLVAGGAGLGIVRVTEGTVTAGSVVIGRDAGSQGRLVIDGSSVTVAGDVDVAPVAGSEGYLTIDRSIVTIGGDLVIGGNGAGGFELVRGERLDVGGALIAPASIEFVIQGASPATASIAVGGNASIGGIVVSFAPDSPPAVGDDFALVVTAASGLAGTPITTPALPVGLAWETSVTDTELHVRVGSDCVVKALPDECAIMSDNCSTVDVRSLLDAGGAPGDGFGAAVDVDGTYAVVSSPDASPPFVTVFAQRGTRWVRGARLFASSGAPGDGFGRSVGIGGSTIVVGAPTAADGGRAYVFERAANGVWSEVATLGIPSTIFEIDGFGASVDTNGDYVIVGARRTSDGQFGGYGYIFARARSWGFDDFLFTSPLGASSRLAGASVAIDGNIAAVVWPGTGTGPGDRGDIVVNERIEDSGAWVNRGAGPPAGTTVVGPAIAIGGDQLAVRLESDVFRGVGIAERQLNGFPFTAFLPQPNGDSFGAALGISGGRLAAGAAGDGSAGRVYTYSRLVTGTWQADETLELSTSGAIGDAVALAGGRAIVGAATDDTQGADAGRAWIADLPGPDCNANGVWDLCDIIAGTSVDADGDGVPDECADACPYDLDESGVVGFNDLSIVLASWGPCPNCLADVSESGSVGFLELSDLLVVWGDCPSE